MDHLLIEGVRPYDGRYEFDLREQPLTVREWGWVRRFSGYLPMTLDDGLAGVDAELMAVFGLVALVRAGVVERDDVAQAWDRFADAPGVFTIRIEFSSPEVEEADPDPPASSLENGSSSGTDSLPSSAIPAELMRATGTPASASSESPRVT